MPGTRRPKWTRWTDAHSQRMLYEGGRLRLPAQGAASQLSRGHAARLLWPREASVRAAAWRPSGANVAHHHDCVGWIGRIWEALAISSAITARCTWAASVSAAIPRYAVSMPRPLSFDAHRPALPRRRSSASTLDPLVASNTVRHGSPRPHLPRLPNALAAFSPHPAQQGRGLCHL